MTEPLPDHETHVWWLEPAAATPAALIACEALLSASELARRDRMRFEDGRREVLLSRALLRTTLSRYVARPPAAWCFVDGPHGRPELATPDPSWLRFNVSHTRGFMVCAVTRDCDLGIDVEGMTRTIEPLEIADRFFSPSEVAALRALPAEQHRDRFFRLWTLKESYIKARGMGLAIPLGHFSFHLDAPPIRITFDPRLPDDPASWQFEERAPTPDHRMAIAIRRGGGTDHRIVFRPHTW